MNEEIASAAAVLIRNIPNFPKQGIMFKDITPLLADADTFKKVIKALAAPFADKGITKVLGTEARGFLLAAPVAIELGAGLVPVRKKGKLPHKTVSASYALEYGLDTLEMHSDAVLPGDKVLIVDDVLATGGTAAAVKEMAVSLGGNIVGASMLIELEALKGREKLNDCQIYSLLKY